VLTLVVKDRTQSSTSALGIIGPPHTLIELKTLIVLAGVGIGVVDAVKAAEVTTSNDVVNSFSQNDPLPLMLALQAI
jgi:hypothetical protein